MHQYAPASTPNASSSPSLPPPFPPVSQTTKKGRQLSSSHQPGLERTLVISPTLPFFFHLRVARCDGTPSGAGRSRKKKKERKKEEERMYKLLIGHFWLLLPVVGRWRERCGSWKRRRGKGEKGEREGLGAGEQSDACCLPLMGSASPVLHTNQEPGGPSGNHPTFSLTVRSGHSRPLSRQ